MAKVCSDINCTNPVFGGGFCKWHQSQRTDKKLKGLQRNKKPLFCKTAVKRVSDKELKRLAKYRPIRDKFLKENPTCMMEGCNRESTLHHARGRIGDLLWNVKYFRNLCWPHHEWVEHHPEEAKELNLSKNRLDKN